MALRWRSVCPSIFPNGSAKTPKMSRKNSSFRSVLGIFWVKTTSFRSILGLFWVKTTSLSGHHSRFGTSTTYSGNIVYYFGPIVTWKIGNELC